MLKSILKRIFPSFLLISALRFFLFDLEVTFLFWPEILLFAFLWGVFHSAFGKQSGKYDEMLVALPVVGTFITLSWPMPFAAKIPAILSAIYLFVVSLKGYLESEIKNKDRIKARKFLWYNIYDMRRLRHVDCVTVDIVERGEEVLGRKRVPRWTAETPEISDLLAEIKGSGYDFFAHSKKRFMVMGRDGMVVLRFLTEPGTYEFKKNKWYKDGKTCTNLTEEGNKILSFLKGERGTNKFVIVKAFEGGEIKGEGAGFFVIDFAKDKDSVMKFITKTTRVENFKDKLSKKRKRVYRALSIS